MNKKTCLRCNRAFKMNSKNLRRIVIDDKNSGLFIYFECPRCHYINEIYIESPEPFLLFKILVSLISK